MGGFNLCREVALAQKRKKVSGWGFNLPRLTPPLPVRGIERHNVWARFPLALGLGTRWDYRAEPE